MFTRDQLVDLSMTLGEVCAGRVYIDAVKRVARMVNEVLNQLRDNPVCDGSVTVRWMHSEIPEDQKARCVMLEQQIRPVSGQVSGNEQLRHWLAMHCPERAAFVICDRWDHDYPKQGKTFFEWHGVEPSLELACYAWADRMLDASCIHLREVVN